MIIAMGAHRNEKKNFNFHVFFLQHMKNSFIIFYVEMNIQLRKILHVHFYTVRETENIHHYQFCRYNTHTRLKNSPVAIMST